METFDERMMRFALQQANYAFEEDEVPIGAVIVCNKRIVAKAYNQVERLNDPTAHAEILAITAACEYFSTKFLKNCTLYITIEPCMMCTGAIQMARIERVVFGASEEKYGFSEQIGKYTPKIELVSGVLEQEAKELMREFFRSKRDK